MQLGIDTDHLITHHWQSSQNTEAALQQSQQMLQLVMDNIPQAIFWKDRHCVYLGCNRQGALDAGLDSPEQIIGLTDYDLPWGKEQADFFRETDQRIMTAKIPEYHLIQCQRQADGKLAWLDMNKIPLHDADGNVVGILVTYEDITERKRVEESLLRISAAVESSSDAIGMSDGKGVHIYQNRAFSQLFEYKSVEALNQAGGPEITFVDAGIAKKIYNSIRSGRSWRGEVIKRSRSGKLLHILLRADAIKDQAGKIVGLICINTDITAQKQGEQEIVESANRLLKVIETVGEGITLSDTTGRFIIFNSKMQEITGYTREESERADDFLRLLYPDSHAYAAALAGLNEILEIGGVRDVETTIRTQYGSYKTLLVSTALVEHENDYLFLSAYRDITDRKRAQEALLQAEAKYRSVFENAIEGIFQTTVDGHYLSVNPALARIYGYYSPAELIEKLTNIERQLYVNPHRRAEFVRLLQDHDAVSNFESQVYRADGEVIWISENARAVRDWQGMLLYYEGTVEDITTQKHAAEAQRQQAEREQLMGLITQRIRQSLELEIILQTTVDEVRQFLQADRVIIYRFQGDGGGVVVESVAAPWLSIQGETIVDSCLTESYLQDYLQNSIHLNEDVETAGLSDCHLDILTKFQVKANLVVPITQDVGTHGWKCDLPVSSPAPDEQQTPSQLWGMLAAHQCSSARRWQELEINLLQQLAAQLAIAIQQAELYQQLQEANRELKRLASLDGLTLIANRRRFDEYLELEWRRGMREKMPVALILCDVDFFKVYNDTYGHQAGDTCLKAVADALKGAVKRPTDLVARYGGEEFAVILPHTEMGGALHVAELIQAEVRGLKLSHQGSLVSEFVTLSLGVAVLVPVPGRERVDLIALADKALYQAKEQGRDRVIGITDGSVS